MNYYLTQAQAIARIALKQNDPVLWDLAKCNLIKFFELKRGL